jgi:orotate phosphoribosyltransferase
VVEDVWTTGGSTRETIAVVEREGGLVVAAGALIDRTGGDIELSVPAHALLAMKVESYDPADCPLCRSGSSTSKPGSRMARAHSS